MKCGEAARRLIADGEDPFRMLALVMWPGRDWSEDALRAELVTCPQCFGRDHCRECGGTGLVTGDRLALLAELVAVA
jgi:hypothetical protein